MKKLNIVLICFIFAAALVFATFGRNINVSDLDIVSGIAIDRNGEKWQVCAEIIKPSKDSAFGSSAELVKGEGFTLENAFKSLTLNSRKIIYTDAVRLVAVSDTLRQEKQVTDFFRLNDVNMRAVTLYCEGRAAELFDSCEQEGSCAVYLADKVKRFCFDIKKPVPKVIGFLNGKSSVYLSKDGNPERSDLTVE